MIDSVTYVISSHPRYGEPLNYLLQSMEYIPNGDKIVVIAESEPGITEIGGITYIYVAHNSFDFTGLIALVDTGFQVNSTHIFPLHDTMELGPRADMFIKDADPDVLATAVAGGQCNLALLRTDYVYFARDFLLGEMNASKQRAIETEGHLWRDVHAGDRDHYPGHTEILGVFQPYSGADRVKEYYTGVDLYKYKANHGQTRPGTYILEP